MALVFPRLLPAKGLRLRSFEIQRVDAMSPENNGILGAVQVGWPRWVGFWEYRALKGDDRENMRAWLSAQRGPMRTFYGFDPCRQRPRLRQPVSTVNSWSVNAGRDVLTFDTDLASYYVSVGDHIGFNWTTGGNQRRALVRVVEKGPPTTTGTVTVTIEPPLHNVVPPGATAVINDANCLMRLDTSQTKIDDVEYSRFQSFTITGIQEILA